MAESGEGGTPSPRFESHARIGWVDHETFLVARYKVETAELQVAQTLFATGLAGRRIQTCPACDRGDGPPIQVKIGAAGGTSPQIRSDEFSDNRRPSI